MDAWQARLNQAKAASATFDRSIDLLAIECAYQAYARQFSPAYLSGSTWYRGPSFVQYLEDTYQVETALRVWRGAKTEAK
jgi:hypothetical protein